MPPLRGYISSFSGGEGGAKLLFRKRYNVLMEHLHRRSVRKVIKRESIKFEKLLHRVSRVNKRQLVTRQRRNFN